MKRNAWLYGLIGMTVAAGIFMAVIGFLRSVVILEALGIAGIVVALLGAAVFGAQDSVNVPCEKFFTEGKYEEMRTFIERKMRSPFFFLMRIAALEHYIRVCMALDDLSTAARYIDRLRHGGGMGWKYRTAYCYILIKLDAGDIETARGEYEQFRNDCAHAEIYKTQLEILSAIFTRLFTARDNIPLPTSAVECVYPVVSRILGRHYEAEVARRDETWD